MDSRLGFDGTQNEINQHKKEQQQQQQHFHVLAVDDSLIDRKLLEKLLTVSSYKVTSVDSVDKALEYLGLVENNSTASCSSSSCSCVPVSSQEHVSNVNLIMTDYSMPGMSGYDLLKRVKGSTWKNVPVVVMSSENVPSRIDMCLEEGAEEFLLKPVQLSDLRKLQSYLLNSINHSCKIMDDDDVVDNDKELVEDDKNISDDEEISIITNDSDKITGTKNANKRKAMSPQPIDRRPKIKELLVL